MKGAMPLDDNLLVREEALQSVKEEHNIVTVLRETSLQQVSGSLQALAFRPQTQHVA